MCREMETILIFLYLLYSAHISSLLLFKVPKNCSLTYFNSVTFYVVINEPNKNKCVHTHLHLFIMKVDDVVDDEAANIKCITLKLEFILNSLQLNKI